MRVEHIKTESIRDGKLRIIAVILYDDGRLPGVVCSEIPSNFGVIPPLRYLHRVYRKPW